MTPRGRKKKETHAVPESMQSRVFARPSFLDKLPSRGSKTANIIRAAEALKAIGADECLVYSYTEYEDLFGEYSKKSAIYIRTTLKAHGINSPRIAAEGEKIYIWSNDIRHKSS